jgi:hypothetical protein
MARVLFALAALPLLALPASGEGVSRAQITRAGKAATAHLTGITPGAPQATAFCIHPSGIFLTNEHAVSQGGTVSLYLQPGTKNARVLQAKVLRADKGLDLALLQVAGEKELPTLPLAADSNLTETDEVIAFGFPFGQRLAPGQTEAPAISVNVGKVTSLREKDGELHRIQVDVVLNPGNSGGPVLDKDGKVVGVVVSGVTGAGVNFAIPVSHLHRFLARPEILFDPPALRIAEVHGPVEFRAEALTFAPSAKPPDLELVLKAVGGPRRALKMEAAGGRYHARAVPLPAKGGPAVVLSARYARGSVTAEVPDQEIKVGGSAVKLSEVRRLVGGARPRVWLREGKVLHGELAGADAVTAQLGATSVTLDLGKAAEVRVQPPQGLHGLVATVIARRAGQEVGRVTRHVAVQGVPQPGEDEVFLDIAEAPLSADRVIYKLEAPVADVAVGGGGRYLIFHLPAAKKLAVFDVAAARVVKSLPAPDTNLKLAASLEHLLVALPSSSTLQRWDLQTLEQDLTAPYPFQGEIVALTMGCSSHGPALALVKTGNTPFPALHLLSVDRLTKRETGWAPPGQRFPFLQGGVWHLRSTADGKATGVWMTAMHPTGLRCVQWDGQIAQDNYSHSDHGHVIPGPGGKVLFTGLGMYTDLAFIQNRHKLYPGASPTGRYVPAYRGDYYLGLGQAPTFNNRNPESDLAVYKLGVEKPLLRLPAKEVPVAEESNLKHDFTVDKRFHLIPEAKLLVVIPPENDRLVLYRVDLEAALAKMGREKK